MREFIEKIMKVEREISAEKGPFILFALFQREDSSDYWDLVAAADWIGKDKADPLRYIANHLKKNLKPDEMINLSRIVLIDSDNPALDAVHKAVSIEHGDFEIKDSNFFGLQIKHAHIITSKREKAPNPEELQPQKADI